MKTLRTAGAILLTFALSAAVAAADEPRLKNDDRLTGTVVRLERGTLTFKTPHGDLQVAWPDVASIKTDRELLVTTGSGEPRSIVIDTAGAGPALGDITAIETPAPPLQWDGAANAGLLTTGGNTDVTNLRLDGELIARTALDRYTTTAVVNRAEDAGRETARNWTAAFAYDRFLTKRLFANASAIFTNDRFRDLDLRTAVGGGLGYQVWDAPAARLSVDGGVGYVDENFASPDDDSYTALREAARVDLFFLAKRLQVFHHHDGYFGVTGEDNLFFRMQNGARVGIASGLVATAQADVDYDRSPAPGRKTTDRSLSMTFGYRF